MVFRPIRIAALALALAPAAASAEDSVSATTPIATVNGAAIELGDLLALRAVLPAPYQELPAQELYDAVRKQLIDQRILSDAAEKAGVADLPGVARELTFLRASYLANRYINDEVARRVDDARVEAAYQARFVDAPHEPQVRASHILFSEKAAADEVLAQIRAGADFAEMARTHGTDGTRERGGDLDWFAREAMVPEFAEAAFAIEREGEVVGPVRTNFGWHLIKLTGKRDKPVPTLEDVRPQLEAELSQEAAAELIEELRAAAAIETPEDQPGLGALSGEIVLED